MKKILLITIIIFSIIVVGCSTKVYRPVANVDTQAGTDNINSEVQECQNKFTGYDTQCYTDLAIKYKSITYCSQTKEKSGKVVCLRQAGISTKDTGICDEIVKEENIIEQCDYYKSEGLKISIDECGSDMMSQKKMCYAGATGDPSMCDGEKSRINGLSDKDKVDICLSIAARESMDSSLCNSIEDSTFKESCLTDTVKSKT